MNEWMNEWMNKCLNVWMSECLNVWPSYRGCSWLPRGGRRGCPRRWSRWRRTWTPSSSPVLIKRTLREQNKIKFLRTVSLINEKGNSTNKTNKIQTKNCHIKHDRAIFLIILLFRNITIRLCNIILHTVYVCINEMNIRVYHKGKKNNKASSLPSYLF